MKQFSWASIRQFAVLVAFKALGDLRTERQRTYLGFLWWFFEPLFLMVVFYLVFAVFMNRGGEDYVVVLLAGLVLWQWFGNSIMHCTTAIQSALPLIRSVRVTPGVFPLATFMADSIKFTVVLVVLVVVLAILGHPPNPAWLAFPAVLLAEAMLSCGACLVVAAIIPFVPDLRFVVAPLLQGMFFLSGIFFTVDSVSPSMRHWLEWNPMAVIIDCGRSILLYGAFPDVTRLGRVMLIGLAVLGFGILLLRTLAHRYPKLAD